MNEIQEFFSFWNKLNSDEQNIIAESISEKKFKKGRQINSEYSECAGIIALKKGTMRVYIISEEGREVTLYRLSEGDICVLSASCILESIAFDIHMDAESDLEILSIPSGTFRSVVEKNIYLKCYMYEEITKKFSEIMTAMQRILFTAVDKRLAVFLCEEYEKNGTRIKMTHEQIASNIGSVREVISRLLKHLEQEGAIKTGRGVLTIEDIDILRKNTI